MAIRADVEAAVPEWTFGDRLRKARKVSGVTLTAIAERMGDRSIRAAQTWEQDRSLPRDPWRVARVYADATGVDYDWLLTGVRTVAGRPPSNLRNR